MAVNSSPQIIIYAVIGNALITAAKFFAWFTTFSPSMLAEAIHSFADTSNQLLLFIGIRHSRRGPSKEFPWGSSRAQYVWNLISAIGIFFIGCGVTIYQGLFALVSSSINSRYTFHESSYYILAFAFIVDGWVFFLALRSVLKQKGNQNLWQYLRFGDNPSIVAVLLEDGIALCGVVIAALGIYLSQKFGSMLPDAFASLIIGALLGGMAVILAFANGRLLIGVSAPPERQLEIKEFIEKMKTIEKVAKIKTTVVGPGQVRLSLEVEFHGAILIDRNQIVSDAEKIKTGKEDALPILVDSAERMVRVVGREINKLERQIKKQFPEVIAIELEVN